MSIYGADANWKSLKQKVMLGGKQIGKIYAGDTLIYPSSESGGDIEPIPIEKAKYSIWAQFDEPINVDVVRKYSDGRIGFIEIPEPINRIGVYVYCSIEKDLSKIKNYYALVSRGYEDGASSPEVVGRYPTIKVCASVNSYIYSPIYVYHFLAYDDRIVQDYFTNTYNITFPPIAFTRFSYNGSYKNMRNYSDTPLTYVYSGTNRVVTIQSREQLHSDDENCWFYVNPDDNYRQTTEFLRRIVIENWNRN